MTPFKKSILVGLLISFCFSGVAYANDEPKPEKISDLEVTNKFPEAERKVIFIEAINAEKRGMAEADRQFPNSMENNLALKQQFTTKHRRDVLKKHGLTEDSKEWRLIAREGIEKKWV